VLRDLLEGASRELQGPPTAAIAIRDRTIVLLTFASGRRRAVAGPASSS
jgi:hypothetical protein